MGLMIEEEYLEWANRLNDIKKISFSKDAITVSFHTIHGMELSYKRALSFLERADVETFAENKVISIRRHRHEQL